MFGTGGVPSLRPAAFPEQVNPPEKWLPSTYWSEPAEGPLLPVIVIPPVTLFEKISMPPVLLVMAKPPETLFPAQEDPAPISTAPVDPLMVTPPVTVDEQMSIQEALFEVIPPETFPPMRMSAPPGLTVMPPDTEPPLVTQVVLPPATVTPPFWVDAMVPPVQL